ncbi:MAG: HAMP domain-containing histidine kinase [Clostridia bacterium]|nr:HAMP domain-containing histidine kinase [Clostridia bacterium]
MRSYRKRFVLFNMVFIGVVLFIAFVGIGLFFYFHQYNELHTTMQQVLQPLSEFNDGFRPDGGRPGGPDRLPEENREQTELPEREQNGGGEGRERFGRGWDRSIATVLYDPETGETSVIGRTDVDAEELLEFVPGAVDAENDFGRLSGGMYFCRAEGRDFYRIAFAPASYLTSQCLTMALVLFLGYLAIMGLLLLLSVKLSAYAVRPAEEAQRMERQFVDDVSHDLKTPISVILANTSILKQDPDSSVSEQSQWIDSTESSARKMLEMVNGMLSLSSLESRSRDIPLIPTDLSQPVEKAVLQAESVAYERNVTVETDIGETNPVQSNSEYVERIASGLLDNALKYEPSGGKVEVSLKLNRKAPELTVRNAGSVIPQEDLEHVFERFYRGDKSRASSGGHGLGLSIVKALADAIHAEISVSSSEGEGTKFTVRFPEK